MPRFLKDNINGILGTVLFHLIVVVIFMSAHLKTANVHKETYLLITPESLEELNNKAEPQPTDEPHIMEDAEIEAFINEIHNVGASQRPQDKGRFPDNGNPTQAELQRRYEEEMLREKYGANYDQRRAASYEDFLPANDGSSDDKRSESRSNVPAVSTGIALVTLNLDNKEREKHAYVDVPVYTCEKGGTVVIKIAIRNDGTVKTATLVSGSGDCLINAAIAAAKKSHFTHISGNDTEYGTIKYEFIEQ